MICVIGCITPSKNIYGVGCSIGYRKTNPVGCTSNFTILNQKTIIKFYIPTTNVYPSYLVPNGTVVSVFSLK